MFEQLIYNYMKNITLIIHFQKKIRLPGILAPRSPISKSPKFQSSFSSSSVTVNFSSLLDPINHEIQKIIN